MDIAPRYILGAMSHDLIAGRITPRHLKGVLRNRGREWTLAQIEQAYYWIPEYVRNQRGQPGLKSLYLSHRFREAGTDKLPIHPCPHEIPETRNHQN